MDPINRPLILVRIKEKPTASTAIRSVASGVAVEVVVDVIDTTWTLTGIGDLVQKLGPTVGAIVTMRTVLSPLIVVVTNLRIRSSTGGDFARGVGLDVDIDVPSRRTVEDVVPVDVALSAGLTPAF